MCDHICEPFRFKNGKAKWPTCNSNEYGFCNEGDLLGMVRVGCMTYFQDYEWYNELADGDLKEEALKQKAIYERSWGDASQSDKEYVAIKECEYDDLTKTNEDACRAYQEIFRPRRKEIDNIGEVSIIWNPMCVVVMLTISAYIDSCLENIDQFFNGFTNKPNEINMDDSEPDGLVDTPLVSPFLDSDDDIGKS
ncbi:hypothetical protein Tco_0344899 [Tanacetum coccineum]